jgi:phytoene dehydrogenase-like protein
VVNQVAQLSNVNPGYAPAGQHLICLQILGDRPEEDEALVERALDEIRPWFPGQNMNAWRLLEVVRTQFGQFREDPAIFQTLPGPRLERGLYMASEVTTQSSIEGALQGGRKAARALLADLPTETPAQEAR